MTIIENRHFSLNRMANSVDPDETARYEPSHQDLHCLQRHLCWSVEMVKIYSVVFVSFWQKNVHKYWLEDIVWLGKLTGWTRPY